MTADVNWQTVENGIFSWVQAGSGLANGHVVWDYFKAPRPATPFVELSIIEIDQVGEDWQQYDDAPDAQPGAELRLRTFGHRQLKLTIQVYGSTDQGDTSRPIMSAIVSSLPLHQFDLDTAGVGVGDVGAQSMVSGTKGGVLEPRARCQVDLHVLSSLESRQASIARFEASVTGVGPDPIAISIDT